MSEEALRIVPSTASIETGLSEAIRTVIDGVVGFVGVLTTTGVLIEANEPAISAANLTRKDVIGKPFWDCYWWSFDATVQDQLRDAVRRATAGQSIRYDVEIRIANDCRMIIDFQLLPHFDATGNVDFLIPSGVDITDRKAQEVALRATRDSFGNLVRNSPFGIYTVDADFRLAMVGAGAEKVFSNIEPLIGRDFAEILRIIWPEPFASEVIELFRKTLATGKPYHSPSTIKQRRNTEEVEAYDWKIERAVLPDGRLGVVCNFYDLSERQEYEAALLASESRFRATFENAAVGIAHVAPDGSWLRVNQTLCDIVGYSKEELSGMTFQDITHPEDLQRDLDQLRRLLDEEIDDYQIHKRYIRKDHSIVWINLTVSAARPERGPLDYLIAVVEDISTEKAAVARQELLVGELNHRVKNSLATIQAMASHTMRSSADMESFKESFGGRLRAMAAAHESIFSAAELQADLATVIRKQLSPYTADSNDRLKLDGPAIPLDPDRVHGLGLIFHELATNAIKHGALSSQTGLISVAWRLETLKGRQRIHLTWTESGGPTVSPPARTGFGSMLIQTTLQDTLQGSAELKYAAEGMVARMIIPLADSAHNN